MFLSFLVLHIRIALMGSQRMGYMQALTAGSGGPKEFWVALLSMLMRSLACMGDCICSPRTY